MKSCLQSKKLLVMFAIGELDAHRHRMVGDHVRRCPRCSSYVEEVSRVSRRLVALEDSSTVSASPFFHQRLQRRLRTIEPLSPWERVRLWACAHACNWRVLGPVAAAFAIAFTVLFLRAERTSGDHSPRYRTMVTGTEAAYRDLQPSIANYQAAADRSLEAFEEFLTKQATRFKPLDPAGTAADLESPSE